MILRLIPTAIFSTIGKCSRAHLLVDPRVDENFDLT